MTPRLYYSVKCYRHDVSGQITERARTTHPTIAAVCQRLDELRFPYEHKYVEQWLTKEGEYQSAIPLNGPGGYPRKKLVITRLPWVQSLKLIRAQRTTS